MAASPAPAKLADVSDTAIVIFGAAVRVDGRPSPALARRIGYGLAASRDVDGAPVFCSGAIGRAGPSEASVMAAALRAQGVTESRIVLDEESRDTFQSVVAVARFMRARGLTRCLVCSDAYHLPRIRLMLALLGVQSQTGPVPKGPQGSRRHWAKMVLREALAVPYDLLVVLTRRRALLGRIGE